MPKLGFCSSILGSSILAWAKRTKQRPEGVTLLKRISTTLFIGGLGSLIVIASQLKMGLQPTQITLLAAALAVMAIGAGAFGLMFVWWRYCTRQMRKFI